MSPPSPIIASLASTRRRGGIVAPKLLALTNLSETAFYATQASGGEAGVATGFGGLILYVPFTAMAGSYRVLGAKQDVSLLDGWAAYLDLDRPAVALRSGSSARPSPFVAGRLSAYDLGRVHALLFVHTGTMARVYHDHTSMMAELAISGYTPSAVAELLGKVANGSPAVNVGVLGRMTFRGTPTVAQLQALLDSARTLGDLPTSMTGATVTHRQSLKDTLSGQSVTDGQLAPATLADTVTGATADAMTRTGSPTVRVIDPSIDGRKSYGFFGASKTSYLQTTGTAGIGGSASTGLHVRMLWRPESLSTTRVLVGRGILNGQGWWIQISGAGVTGVAGNGATATYTIQASELNQWHVVEMVLTGSTVRLYWDGVKVGSDASAAFTPYAGPMIWGWCNHTGTEPGSMETFGALGGGNYGVTDAEVLAAYQETMRTGRLAATAGKTQHLYDLSIDIAPAPDAGVPAQILDRIGTDHLTRVGTGLVVSRRTERLWSYETTPVMIGARGWGSANYFAGAMTGFGHTAVPFWFMFPIVVHTKSGSSLNIMGKASGGGTSGFNPYSSSGFASIGMYIGTGPSYAAAPTLTVLDSDLGRPILIAYQWTGSMLQAFARRARTGGDVTMPSYGAYTGNLSLGRHPEAATNPLADQATILGIMGGLGNLTLSEYQSAHDAFFSEEDLVAVPGKTARLYSTRKVALANGGALAALVDQMGSGESLQMVGAPTVSNLYQHAA